VAVDGHAQDAARDEVKQSEAGRFSEDGLAASLVGDSFSAASLLERDVDGATRQRLVQRLQRTVGNRVVSRLLADGSRVIRTGQPVQRQTPPAAAPPLASAVRISNGGGDPTISGTVSAAPVGVGDSVRITAPDTSLAPTDVEIPAGVTLGNGKSIQVGVMQTLMGSTRVAHYRSWGANASEPTTDKRQELGQARDAAADLDPATGSLVPRAQAPFYLPPVTVSDVHVTDTIQVSEGKQANLLDRPGWPARASLGSGEFSPRLVGTSGSDDFITSIAAKYSSESGLNHLKQSKWSVPWSMTIDPLGAGQGAAGAVEASKIPPPETPGDIAAIQARLGKGKDWIEFPTLGDAMMCSVGVLLGNLAPAKANDPQSFAFTVQALCDKNPQFELSFTVDKKLRGAGQERVNLLIGGFGSAPPRNWEMDAGETQTTRFHLLEILEEGSIMAGRPITFQITVEPVFGSAINTSRTMAFPYLSISESFAIGEGQYELTVKLRG